MTATRDPWVHTFETTLPADRERVFAALTTTEPLMCWFADHVQVELREGGAFRFWGRHSYGTPDGADANQRVTRLEPPTMLAFSWQFEGVPSEVTLTATPAEPDKDGARTTLELRHSFPARLNVPWSEELVDDLWRLTLGNLQAYLRGGDGIVLPDYTDPNPEIRLSIVINAPRDRGFRALIEPDAMNTWLSTAADVDPRVGGHYRYGWTYRRPSSTSCQTSAWSPTGSIGAETTRGRRPGSPGCSTTSRAARGWTLVHGGFSRVVDQGDYPFGWVYFIEKLKATVETT